MAFKVNSDLVITGQIDAQNNPIINLAPPVNPSDVTTKDYVDTAVSANAGELIRDDQDNLVAGTDAGTALLATTASGTIDNITIGTRAGQNLNNHPGNIAIGTDSLVSYATGLSGFGWNIAIGSAAMKSLDGNHTHNVAVGRGAIENQTSVDRCTAIGTYALQGPSTIASGAVSNTVAIGFNAMSDVNGNAFSNVAVGADTFVNFTSGNSNVAVGDHSGIRGPGNRNVTLGYYGGQYITGGDQNITIGTYAGPNTQGTYYNKMWIDIARTDTPLIYGDFATDTITINGNLVVTGTLTGSPAVFTEDANSNIVGGVGAGASITTGTGNFFAGDSAGNAIQFNDLNVIIGHTAGSAIVGDNNIVIGAGSAANVSGTTNSNNIFIGTNAGPLTVSAVSNKIFIDTEATDTPLIYGDTTTGAKKITINGDFEVTGSSNLYQDLGEFTLATLPDATVNANSYALVTDAAGGRTVVRSDGTAWKIIAVEGGTVA